MAGRQRWALSRSRLTSWTIGSLAIGLALLILSPLTPWAWLSPVVNALGSAVVSIAGALIITEYFLKPTYTADILELVGLDQEVHQTALSELRPESRVDWAAKYAHVSHVRAVVSEPRSFLQVHWPEIVEAAKKTSVTVEILVPSTGSRAAASSAGYGDDVDLYDREVAGVCRAIEGDWSRLSAGMLDDHSRMTIDPVTTTTPFGVYATERQWSIVINALAADRTSPRFALSFRSGEGSTLERWIEERFALVDANRETPRWRSPNWDRNRKVA